MDRQIRLMPFWPVANIMGLTALIAGTISGAEIPAPREQIKNFQLPPGFQIQLVVADPEIGQPMNLNFDVRGRLWVTSSVEYPYPAQGEGVQDRPARFGKPSDHAPRDRVTVIEGIGPDGTPKSITHFAEGLNIPIGVTPIGEGDAALAYSIPAIHRFADTDRDGKSDVRKAVYARFGNVDTHGMSNAYTRWIDGWIYGCHGFSNHSEITDAAGRVTKLRSGNTYRFQEDGSRFEQFTFGQVNPFGLTFDPLGNLYSADCHSMPLYLLLRGAKYPHFGDKPDGLGFGPTMMRHNHGSTGICGPAFYAADHFPKEFRDNLFVCNPVTGRINRDTLEAHGSTYQCVEQPDFVRYDGNLFRPVDCIVGPDGALYIADFCNSVIGHYEAPLDHPERDRTHGRVWRIIYRGLAGGEPPPEMMPDLTKLSAKELFALLGDANLQVRTLATNYLVDARADKSPALAESALASSGDEHVRAHCLWILERLNALDDATLDKHAEDKQRLVRVHATRILAERETWSELNTHSARLNLFDGDAFVCRAAADALGRHPSADFVPSLLARWEKAPADDTHLIHTIRLALRSHVRDPAVVAELMQREFDKDTARRLVEIAAAADSEAAAPIFLAHAEPAAVSREVIEQAATSIARNGSPKQLARLIELSPKWFADDERQQFAVLAAAADGLRQKGLAASEQTSIQAAMKRLAPRLIKSLADARPQWRNYPVPNLPQSSSPWGARQRGSTDGKPEQLFWDSIAHGEQLTGILRSEPLAVPEKFSFWMCGHNGHPDTKDARLNHIRLLHAKTGKVLAQEFPPRNDVARKYDWALKEHAGEQVVVEIVDAHQAGAYAWIAAGRFDPPILRVTPPDADRHALALVEMIGQFGLRELSADVRQLALDTRQAPAIRQAALESYQSLAPVDDRQELLTRVLVDVAAPIALRGDAAELLSRIDDAAAGKTLDEALAHSPAQLQRRIALALSQTDRGRGALLAAIAAGRASPRLLQAPRIAEQFNAHAGEADKRRAAELAKNLPPRDEQIAKLIAHHRDTFQGDNASIDRGRALFKKHCANCHRVGDQGSMIGPQLDGIGNRGLERVLEDVFDPNRNVDVAFRAVNIETVNGKVLSGVERRREGEILILADQEGKEISVPLADIAAQRRTNLSLMPSNFGETLQENELRDLTAWLLAQQAQATQGE